MTDLWHVLGWDARTPGSAVLAGGDLAYRPTHDPARAGAFTHDVATAIAATLTARKHLGFRWKPVPEGTHPHEHQSAHRSRRDPGVSTRPDGLPDGW